MPGPTQRGFALAAPVAPSAFTALANQPTAVPLRRAKPRSVTPLTQVSAGGVATAALIACILATAGCDGGGPKPAPRDAAVRPLPMMSARGARPPAPVAEPVWDLVTPAAPGTPGGLPDDKTPVSEAPFSSTSAQGAADVMQTYYAYLGAGLHEEAWRLWGGGGQGSGANLEEFIRRFADFDSYRANIGAPGAIKRADGSLYVRVPVQISARFKDGRELRQLGSATLERSSVVPGAAPEQQLWRIQAITLKDQ